MIVENAAAKYDIFIDLSPCGFNEKALASYISAILHVDGALLAAVSVSIALPRWVFCSVPPHVHLYLQTPTVVYANSMAAAALGRRHLFVIFGPLLPPNEIVTGLIDALRDDPMLGSAAPRFATGDNIHPVPSRQDPTVQSSRSALRHLPPTTVTAEMVSACLLLRKEVVAWASWTNSCANSRSAVARHLTQARRRGFRNVVCNRLVVSTEMAGADVYPDLDSDFAATVSCDYAAAQIINKQNVNFRLEVLLTAAFPDEGKRRILIDCRGLVESHNGTARCIIGILDGFLSHTAVYDFDIRCEEKVALFHDLYRRYPKFGICNGEILGSYAAAFMPSQPWSINAVAELHNHAYAIFFCILDTIAWDVVYLNGVDMEETWRFISRFANGLSFISRFSFERFIYRFPISSYVEHQVTYLSVDVDESTLLSSKKSKQGRHILLFGNLYDHKAIEQTLTDLISSFPFQEFVVIGGVNKCSVNVRCYPSGLLSESDVHNYIATALAVIYPSYYEGFGLPVIEALGYNRLVFVRRSLLWKELAAFGLPGQILEFDDPPDLLRQLRSVIDRGYGSLGVTENSACRPSTWRTCASHTLDLIEQALHSSTAWKWLDRDQALRLAGFVP